MKKPPLKSYVISQALVYWLTALAGLMAFGIAALLNFYDHDMLQEAAREELSQELRSIERTFEYKLRRRVETTAGLSSYIQSQPNLTQEQFENIAARIMALSNGLAGVQLERNGEISHVYPSGIYQGVVGKTLGELYDTDDDGDMSPKSPPMPKHETPGMLAYRNPIQFSVPGPDGQKQEIWGYVIYLIDVEDILRATGILRDEVALELALIFKPDQSDEELIFGDPRVLGEDPVIVNLGLPGGEWILLGVDRGWRAIMEKHHQHRQIVLSLAVLFFTLWAYSILSRLRAHGLVSDVEAARVESEKQFSFLIREASVDPIGIYDQEGRILEFNEEATRYLGYTREELLKLTVYDIDCGLGHEEIENGLKKLRPGLISRFRTQHRRKDGSVVPVEMRLGVVETGQGLRVICSARDISAQRRYEEELENLNHNKDKFFSIIAHDLKGPLSGFMGLTEMLAQDLDSFSQEDLRVLGTEMHKAGKNLFNLLEDLLDWSRLQMGRIEAHPQRFAIRHVLEANVALLGVNARAKEITLETDMGQEAFVNADLDMVNTVVRNLLSNAIKFTPRGGKVSIATRKVGSQVITAIQDTGIGMTPKQILNLFTPGAAIRSDGTEREKGTGMGLMLCHELLQRNSGELKVESEEGKGSTFTFILPVAKGNESTASATTSV